MEELAKFGKMMQEKRALEQSVSDKASGALKKLECDTREEMYRRLKPLFLQYLQEFLRTVNSMPPNPYNWTLDVRIFPQEIVEKVAADLQIPVSLRKGQIELNLYQYEPQWPSHSSDTPNSLESHEQSKTKHQINEDVVMPPGTQSEACGSLEEEDEKETSPLLPSNKRAKVVPGIRRRK